MRRTRMHELVPSCNDWRQEKSLQKNAPRTLNCCRSMPPTQDNRTTESWSLTKNKTRKRLASESFGALVKFTSAL